MARHEGCASQARRTSKGKLCRYPLRINSPRFSNHRGLGVRGLGFRGLGFRESEAKAIGRAREMPESELDWSSRFGVKGPQTMTWYMVPN